MEASVEAKVESMVDSMVKIKAMLQQSQHSKHQKLLPKELVYNTLKSTIQHGNVH